MISNSDYLEQNTRYGKLFLDPHDAWNDYITTGETNNWFACWYNPGPAPTSYDPDYGVRKFGTAKPVGSDDLNWSYWYGQWSSMAWHHAACKTSNNVFKPNDLCNTDNPFIWDDTYECTSVGEGYHLTDYYGTPDQSVISKIQLWWDITDALAEAYKNGEFDPMELKISYDSEARDILAPIVSRYFNKTATDNNAEQPGLSADGTPTVPALKFRETRVDVTGNVSDWANNQVTQMINSGIGSEFAADDDFTRPVTRGEFAMLAVRTYQSVTRGASWDYDNYQNPLADVRNTFTDAGANDLYIQAAYNLGIINGKSATEFAPNDPLTREQAATMLGRLASALDKDCDVPVHLVHEDRPLPENPFTDKTATGL